MIAALLLAAAAPAAEDRLPDFEPSAERFADAAGCRSHLERLVADARDAGFDAAEEPYELAAGDVRAHTVRADGAGHRIEEFRCDGAALGARRWTRSMAGGAAAEEEPFTVDSVARRAPWLNHSRRQQR